MSARSTAADVRTAAPRPYHRHITDLTPEPLPVEPNPAAANAGPSPAAAAVPTPPTATAPLPSPGARAFAVFLIVVAGLCGGLIGYAVADLQTTDAPVVVGLGALVGAVVAAGGVAVVAVLALRAMAEWETVQERQQRPS